jgi:hypothetical protein
MVSERKSRWARELSTSKTRFFFVGEIASVRGNVVGATLIPVFLYSLRRESLAWIEPQRL